MEQRKENRTKTFPGALIVVSLSALLLFLSIRGYRADFFSSLTDRPVKEEVSGVLIKMTNSFVNSDGTCLEERILPPPGYTRTVSEENSFAAFLRTYPLEDDGAPIRLYNGRKRLDQSKHIAVFKLPLERRDLQQCADSVLRAYAEYFYKTGQFDRIKFYFTNGFLCDYASWRAGKRLRVKDDVASWVEPGEASDSKSYDSFVTYLQWVFTYAGTISMSYECFPIEEKELQIGDVFLEAGNPGHVCLVVDLCEKDGKKAFLLAQGHMPAQSFHVMKNPLSADDPWYYLEDLRYPFITTEYVFKEGSFMRPSY